MIIFISNQLYAAPTLNLSIVKFNYERTVLRLGDEIPVVLNIWNGDIDASTVKVELKISNNLSFKTGTTLSNATLDPINYTELRWTLNAASIGSAIIDLNVIVASGDTLKSSLTGVVTDQYYIQKEFLLSAWSAPQMTQPNLDYYKGANFSHAMWVLSPFSVGVNLVKQNKMTSLVNIVEAIPNYLAKLYGFSGNPAAITASDLTAMGSTLNAYKNENAVDGYMIIDEPGASRFANISKVVAEIRTKSPTKLAFVNLLPTYATADQTNTSNYVDYVYRFLNEVKPEMLSYDYYNFFVGYDSPDYFYNLEIIRNYGLKYNVPYTNIIQLIGTEAQYVPTAPNLNWRTPSPAEHRFLVYTSLAYGYTGIVWFHWQESSWGLTAYPVPKQAEIYNDVTQLNKEIKNIGAELIKLKSVGTFHIGGLLPNGTNPLPADQLIYSVVGSQTYVVGLYKDALQNDYFMVMNKDYTTNSDVVINLKSYTSKLEHFDANLGSWVNIPNYTTSQTKTQFNTTITAGNGILYRRNWTSTDFESVYNKKENNTLRVFPNPFVGSTTIEYDIPENQEVEIMIYNVMGNCVYSSGKHYKSIGLNTEIFDASKLVKGVYLCSIQLKDRILTKLIIH